MKELKQTRKAIADRERYRRKVEAAGGKVGEKQERVNGKFAKTHGANSQSKRKSGEKPEIGKKEFCEILVTLLKAEVLIRRLKRNSDLFFAVAVVSLILNVFLIAFR
jgi:hypothetical protein